ncbi:MAG TPA: nucleotide exchange factor GrpE [Bacteroidia bacterium]|nr:nucleotide exchange factor GrpE [Bacteroidia bacterium]HNT80212.1 nucleotide exchange factor GrpE [Bacteroidia bacterium]
MKSIFSKKEKTKEKEMESKLPEEQMEDNAIETENQTEVVEQQTEETNFEQLYNEEKDKYLRLYADFDNFRKRSLKERMDLLKSAGSDVITSLLPVLDDFERAITNIKDQEQLSGIILIYNKFKSLLEQKGLKEMNSINEVFNADLHDAITKIKVEEVEKDGKVVDVLEKGYYLNDKIIRHAKVVVGEK